MKKKPNILFITTDQHRQDCLGCYGNPMLRTPNLDRLAREGVRFSNAFGNSVTCGPSRASILTGKAVQGHRHWTNEHKQGLSPDETFFSQILADQGYDTALIGKAHFTSYGTVPHWASSDESIPCEQRHGWQDGRFRDWHGLYYGFQHVDLCLENPPFAHHHRYWLQDHMPKALDLIEREWAAHTRDIVKPPQHAPQSWKSRIPLEAHNTTYVTDRSVAYIEERSHGDRPFFLWTSFPEPHHPFKPIYPYSEMYDPQQVPMPVRLEGKDGHGIPYEFRERPPHHLDNYLGRTGYGKQHGYSYAEMTDDQYREIIAHTYGMISMVDDGIGRIFGTLDRLGLWENTLVVFASDHGEMLGDHWTLFKGAYMYQGLIRIPLIVRMPGTAHSQRRGESDAFVQHFDLAPTFLRVAGVPVDRGMQGQSLVPLIEGKKERLRDCVLLTYQMLAPQHIECRALQNDRWKLIFYSGQAYGELYDLERDANEFANLWDSAKHQQIKAGLIHQMLHEELSVGGDL